MAERRGRKGKRPSLKPKLKPDMSKTRMRTIWVTNPTEPFVEVYEQGKQLGQPGQFGHAYRCIKKENREVYAVKVISKNRFHHIPRENRTRLLHSMQAEISILQTLDHPYTVRLNEVFEDKKFLYLVMEECTGGELFEAIVKRGRFSEQDASRVLRMMLDALYNMHFQHRIVHCDLKPDNILFLNNRPDSPIKIIDFGMSKVLPRLSSLNNLVGTPYYTAPEVLNRAYSFPADMWSVGVIMYVMLFGYPPFYVDPARYGKNENKAIYAKIRNGFLPIVKNGYGPWFNSKFRVSSDARDLMARLLEMQVDKRITSKEALQHPWFGNSPDENLAGFIESMSTFTSEYKFKTAVIQIFRSQFMEQQPQALELLREQFRLLDTNGDGIVTYQEFEDGLSRIDGISVNRIQNIFRELNTNGEIRFEEVLDAAVHDHLIQNDERLYNCFRDLDDNEDGFITTEDLIAKMHETDLHENFSNAEEIAAFIREADLDRDGHIDYEEFLRILHPNFNENENQDEEGPPMIEEGDEDADATENGELKTDDP